MPSVSEQEVEKVKMMSLTKCCAVAVLLVWAQGLLAFDVAAGKERARACFSCHGANGISVMPATPHLAGQNHAYLVKAMRDYQNGHRKDPTMAAMVAPLTEQDIVNIAAYFSLSIEDKDGQRLVDAALLAERLRPVGRVYIQAAAESGEAPEQEASEEKIGPEGLYRNHCAACHDSGVAGAPVTGSQESWAGRIDKGADVLAESVIRGLNAMPPRWACAQCTNEEISSIVAFMLEDL
jgi:cytochrome c5